jgi:N-acetylmuramoyl-L-alanine amidase
MARKSFTGSKVVDVQRRLKLLGYDLGKSEIDGILGPQTKEAIKKFQQDRGLVVTGIVDEETWQELVGAGYKIGDRLLYLKYPPFRGDDVKILQLWLKTLGFYTNDENGIFCEKTQKALIEFQKNINIPADGIFGESTLKYFKNLRRILDSQKSSNYPFIKESIKNKKAHEFKVLLDYGENINEMRNGIKFFKDKIYICKSIANFCRDFLLFSGIESAITVSDDDNASLFLHDRIGYANRSNADILISLNLGFSSDEDANGSSCFYFKGVRSYSETGKIIANLIQDKLVANLKVLDCRVHGASYSILKETIMTAVLVEPAFISNSMDKENLLKTEYQMGISKSIGEAVIEFLNS